MDWLRFIIYKLIMGVLLLGRYTYEKFGRPKLLPFNKVLRWTVIVCAILLILLIIMLIVSAGLETPRGPGTYREISINGLL